MSNIPEGYKQTEVGVIPEDWDIISYGEAFDFLSTASYSRADLSDNDEAFYVHYGNIHTTWNFFLDFKKHNPPTIEKTKLKNYSFIKDGDLIMADASEDYGGIGKSVEVKNITTNKAISGLHTFLLRGKDGIFADGFKGYIHSNRLVKTSMDRLATGLKVYGVSKTNLKTIQIPLPTLPEQNAIATVLSDTDALIEHLGELIAKKIAIKQGAMQQLLTGEKRLPGFSGEWEVKRLGKIAEVKDGTHRTPKYFDSGIPFYSVESVTNNDFTNTKYISEAEHKLLTKKFKIEEMDILMTRIGSIGDCKLITWSPNASFYVSLALLKPKNKANSPYIYHFFKTSFFKRELEDRSLQWAIPKKINLGEISKVKICIPKEEPEQAAIATILSDMDSEIESLEQKRDKYKAIKQGMMQELLTGKTRLV